MRRLQNLALQVGAPGFDLRSPSAILSRLGGQPLDRKAGHTSAPRLNLRFQSGQPPELKVGAPGFEPGTSASRTQRSTELSHAPKFAYHRPENVPAGTRGAGYFNGRGGIDLGSPPAILARLVGQLTGRSADHSSAPRLELIPPHHLCTPNGRGGIRTHEGINPHDFQSCALSRSATRPNSDLVSAVQLPTAPRTTVRRLGSRIPHVQQDILQNTEGVGFEPTRTCVQRLSRASP